MVVGDVCGYGRCGIRVIHRLIHNLCGKASNMDALKVLRREHTRIAQLFAEFDGLSDCACTGRRALVRELDELVRRHIEVEEALIYERTSQSPDEHRAALRLLDEIAQTECHSPVYVSRVHALRDVLLAHMQEEEAHVFPSCAGYAQVA